MNKDKDNRTVDSTQLTSELIKILEDKKSSLKEIEKSLHELVEYFNFYKFHDEALQSNQEREWVSVKERLPEPEDDLLMWDGSARIRGWMNDDKTFYCPFTKSEVLISHWMELPKPPIS